MSPAFIFLSIMAAIFFAMVFIALHTVSECREWSTIMYVGTCDKQGYCAVAYPDESYSREYKPEVGKEICKKSEEVFKW